MKEHILSMTTRDSYRLRATILPVSFDEVRVSVENVRLACDALTYGGSIHFSRIYVSGERTLDWRTRERSWGWLWRRSGNGDRRCVAIALRQSVITECLTHVSSWAKTKAGRRRLIQADKKFWKERCDILKRELDNLSLETRQVRRDFLEAEGMVASPDSNPFP